ncbi:hypothetical protein FA95DRAFT_1204267 [Auriscalpium vulgare]|uniref:Uncharacterized protein n=1 Tax=Auriscalpium vulgare TaxID=40419 RepID=A0ACB8RUR6_9AGAM|nr:hypothetical protein FA95DRAFT_1204267 [Auriscalpium vulgare]
MPVTRHVRRSRRLSNQPPSGYMDDLFGLYHAVPGPASEYSDFSADATTPSPAPSDFQPISPTALAPLQGHNLRDYFDDDFLRSIPALADFLAPYYPNSPPPQTSSHGRKRKNSDNHVKRPPNAFILYRSYIWATRRISSLVERDHRFISMITGRSWQGLELEQRNKWKFLANWARERHMERYPDYKYSPQSRRERSGSGSRRAGQSHTIDESARCAVISRLMAQGFESTELEEEVRKHDERVAALLEEAEEQREVSSRSRRRPRRASRAVRGKAPSPHVKYETSATPELTVLPDYERRPSTPHLVDVEDDFVKTANIPPIDISAPASADGCAVSEFKSAERIMGYDLPDPAYTLPTVDGLRPVSNAISYPLTPEGLLSQASREAFEYTEEWTASSGYRDTVPASPCASSAGPSAHDSAPIFTSPWAEESEWLAALHGPADVPLMDESEGLANLIPGDPPSPRTRHVEPEADMVDYGLWLAYQPGE